MKKKKNVCKCCETCDYLVPIGDGDFLCEHNLIMVVSDYTPTENYFCCGGGKWQEN